MIVGSMLRSLGQRSVATTPTEPTLISVISQGDGDSVIATMTGDTGVTNLLYYRTLGDTAWTVGESRSGDGTITQTGLTGNTSYDFIVVSQSGGCLSLPSRLITVNLATNLAVESDLDFDAMLLEWGVATTYNHNPDPTINYTTGAVAVTAMVDSITAIWGTHSLQAVGESGGRLLVGDVWVKIKASDMSSQPTNRDTVLKVGGSVTFDVVMFAMESDAQVYAITGRARQSG